MGEGNGFMSEVSHEDAKLILTKLGEIVDKVTHIEMAQHETSGKMKGNQEITELKLAHMEETAKLRDDKQAAEIALIDKQVNVNKSGIKDAYDLIRDTVSEINTGNNNLSTEMQTLKVQVKVLIGAIIVMAPMLVYGIVQMILIWGKVKGF